MATADDLATALTNYIAGRGPAPSWLGQLQSMTGSGQNLYNMVNYARSNLGSGVADPGTYINQLFPQFQNLIGQAFPNGIPDAFSQVPTATNNTPLPTTSPDLGTSPGGIPITSGSQYGGNAIPNYQAPNSGAAGVNPALTDQQKSAQAQLNSTLAQFGLSGLGSQLWSQYLQGTPIEQIYLNMRNTPEYQARFPAMAGLDKQGRSITESDYINLEKSYRQVLNAAGISQDILPDTPGSYAGWISGDVSPTEVKDRASLASQAALTAPNETRAELQRLYGIGQGDLTAYWLAPDKALPALQQRFAAAQLAGSADRASFGSLSQSQAEQLASLGLSDAQTSQGFTQLAGERELFNPLDAGESGISQDQQLQAQFGGNADVQQAIQRRIARRKAAFSGGGNFADSAAGLTGVGTNVTG